MRLLEALTPEERDSYLEQLKIFGRDPTNADPIFTKDVSYSALIVHIAD